MSGTQELLRDAIETTDARITARFDLEKTRRTLPVDFPSIERAKLLFDLRQGLVFRARAGFEDAILLDAIDKNVAAVLAA